MQTRSQSEIRANVVPSRFTDHFYVRVEILDGAINNLRQLKEFASMTIVHRTHFDSNRIPYRALRHTRRRIHHRCRWAARPCSRSTWRPWLAACTSWSPCDRRPSPDTECRRGSWSRTGSNRGSSCIVSDARLPRMARSRISLPTKSASSLRRSVCGSRSCGKMDHQFAS